MNNKRWHDASKVVLFVTLLGSQALSFAGRTESSTDSGERAQRAEQRVSATDREQTQSRLVHDNRRSELAIDSARDAQLADYLEMHGRLVDGSIRSTMMPWSALPQVTN